MYTRRRITVFWSKPATVPHSLGGPLGFFTIGINFIERSNVTVSDRLFLVSALWVVDDIYHNHNNHSEIVRNYKFGDVVPGDPPLLNISAVGRGLDPGSPRQLQQYEVLQRGKTDHTSGAALSLIFDFAAITKNFSKLPRVLPPIPKQAIIDAWHQQLRHMKKSLLDDVAEYTNEVDDIELQPELQPALPGDDLPTHDDIDDEDIIWDTGEHTGWDSLDIKNMTDFDPDQDPEQEFYTDDVGAWSKQMSENLLPVPDPCCTSN
ncbi:MAG: hypothetical protein Q9166_000973 [cf. Caloplaca sp. 2 TL-2023]